MNYYYANKENRPVGPCTAEQMRQLHLHGTLHDNSWVIMEGESEWKSYAAALLSSRDEGQNGAATNRCPGCGAGNDGQAQYCAECGTKLPCAPSTEGARAKSAETVLPQSSNAPTLPLLTKADSTLRGYGGWLAFFCAVQIIIAPIAAICFSIIIPLLSGNNDRSFARLYPGANFLMNLDSIVNYGIVAFGMYAGIQLRRLQPGAVRVAKRYLLAALFVSFAGLFLPQVCGELPAQAIKAWGNGQSEAFARTLIGFAIWFTYFKVSRRVKATYSEG